MISISAKRCTTDHCKKAETDNLDEGKALLSGDNDSGSCGFFKKCKDYVLPSKAEVFHLILTFIGLVTINAFTTFLMKIILTIPPEQFKNTTAKEVMAIDELNNSVLKTLFITSIPLGTIINIAITFLALSIAACIKSCTANPNTSKDQDDENNYGSGGLLEL